MTGRVGLYTASTDTTGPYKRDETFVGYIGAYGVTTDVNSGQASDAWPYTYTVPDSPATPVNLNHPGTVSFTVASQVKSSHNTVGSHIVLAVSPLGLARK